MFNNIARLSTGNITTRRKKNKMAASTVVATSEQNASLYIDDILSQHEEDEITKMMEEEERVNNNADDHENKNKLCTDSNGTGEGDGDSDSDGDDDGDVKPPDDDKGNTTGTPRKSRGMDKLLEETTIDDLNDVLDKIGIWFDEMDQSLDEYRASLEFSQGQIDDLKKENEQLKLKIKTLEKEDGRNEYQIKDLDEKCERLDTLARKRNLIFEGVGETDGQNRENTQRVLYDIFDQMGIDHSVECDTCYRTGSYSKNNKRTRPIVVTFLKQSDRDHVYARRINLKKSKDYSKIWVNEDLAPNARRAKTMVRLITRQANDKGIPCKTNKFSITVDNVKYSESNLDELPQTLSTKNIKQIQIDHQTIAYQSEHAPFSSLYTAKFTVGDMDFDNSEQALQHYKAKKHNRPLLAERILLCRKAYTIKQIGDEVITTDDWNKHEEELMFAIQMKKFQQNPDLAKKLIATGTCELVEATPCKKWGAGATLSSNVLKKHEWTGENRHGKILMTVRAKLIREAAKKSSK